MDALNKLMREKGFVKKEIEATFFGKEFPSRGFYIVEPSGRWHLHHDGLVKDGVNADSENPAFWPTEESAVNFFEDRKLNIAGTKPCNQ